MMDYDGAGTIVSVGFSVISLKPGDEVYTRITAQHRGTAANYTLLTPSATAKKPASLSFTETGSIPLAALTALQPIQGARNISLVV